jgi:hypothetical protein
VDEGVVSDTPSSTGMDMSSRTTLMACNVVSDAVREAARHVLERGFRLEYIYPVLTICSFVHDVSLSRAN